MVFFDVFDHDNDMIIFRLRGLCRLAYRSQTSASAPVCRFSGNPIPRRSCSGVSELPNLSSSNASSLRFLHSVSSIMLLSLDASLLRHGVEDECLQFKGTTRAPSKGPGYPPVFAFRISGTGGEHHKILRLPMALYHPRNRYLLHLDAG